MARAMEDHRQRMEEQLLRGPDKWVHHVADLDQGEEVRTLELDRPIRLRDRLQRVSAVVGFKVPPPFFLAERTLTPRAPYQASPLSYLNAKGDSWNLWAEDDRLEWAEFGAAGARYGGIDFWFRNVTPGTTKLVTIEVSAGAITGPGVTGILEVSSGAAPTRVFPFTGAPDLTLDLLVHPKDPYAVLVTLEPKDGVGYLALKEASYGTVER